MNSGEVAAHAVAVVHYDVFMIDVHSRPMPDHVTQDIMMKVKLKIHVIYDK
jgi:hypothetical protein